MSSRGSSSGPILRTNHPKLGGAGPDVDLWQPPRRSPDSRPHRDTQTRPGRRPVSCADYLRRSGKLILQRVGRESGEMRMRHGVRAESDAPLSRAEPSAPSSRSGSVGIRGSVRPPQALVRPTWPATMKTRSRQAVLFQQRSHFAAEIDEGIVEGQRDCVLARRSPQQRLQAHHSDPPRRQPLDLLPERRRRHRNR